MYSQHQHFRMLVLPQGFVDENDGVFQFLLRDCPPSVASLIIIAGGRLLYQAQNDKK